MADAEQSVITVKLVEFEDRTHRANVIVTKGTTWDMFTTKVKERLGYLKIDSMENEDGDPVQSLEDLEHRGTVYVQGQSYAKLKRLHNAYQNRTVADDGKVETTSKELAALMDDVELAIDRTVAAAKAAEEEAYGSLQLRVGQFRARFFGSSIGIGLEPGENNIGAIVSIPPEPGADGSGASAEDAEEDERMPVCAEDTLIYVEDAGVAGIPFEDAINAVRAARAPRALVFERARTVTLVLEERVGLHFKLDPQDKTRKLLAQLPRQNAARFNHLVTDSYYVFALNGEDVTNCTPAEIASKVDREAAPWMFICVRADLPKKIGFDAIAAEQLKAQNSRRFLIAARSGDLEALSTAIEVGHQDTSVTNAVGWGAVHFSAANGRLLILNRMLKERGKTCLAAVDVSGQTALHVASSRGQIGAVDLLLRSGSPRVDDLEGRNALHLAAQYGHADVVRSLIGAGYDPQRPDGTWQWPALHWAAKGGNVEVVRIIVDLGVDIRLDCAAVGSAAQAGDAPTRAGAGGGGGSGASSKVSSPTSAECAEERGAGARAPMRALEIAKACGHAAAAEYLLKLMDSEPAHLIYTDRKTGGALWIGDDAAYFPEPLEERGISVVLCIVDLKESAYRVKKPPCIKRKFTVRIEDPADCDWEDLRKGLATCMAPVVKAIKQGKSVLVHSRECGAAAQGVAAAFLILRAKYTAPDAVERITLLHGEMNAALNDAEGEYARGLGEIEGAMEDRELERQSIALQTFFKRSVTHSSCP